MTILKNHIKSIIKHAIPNLFYLRWYHRAAQVIGDKAFHRTALFQQLIDQSQDKQCLQIGVRGEKYGPHWTSVDLFDESALIDFNYDIHALNFENECFDVIVCNAVLEHVEDPLTAIDELNRVLKNAGQIWVEIPFNQPYHPSPNDYWRVTLEGMRIWMKDFEEISAGMFKINRSSIYNGIFYFGSKYKF